MYNPKHTSIIQHTIPHFYFPCAVSALQQYTGTVNAFVRIPYQAHSWMQLSFQYLWKFLDPDFLGFIYSYDTTHWQIPSLPIWRTIGTALF